MKLIVELKRGDDKWEKHVCNDFPTIGSDYITLFKENFKRETIKSQSVIEIKQYFKK